MEKQRTLIAILLENEPGNLSRVIGLFSQRNFNIESLSVAPTADTSLSRVNITTRQHNINSVEQISKQLNKLVPVYKLAILTEDATVRRELALIKLRTATQQEKLEAHFILSAYKADVLDMGKNYIVAQLVASASAIDALVESVATKIIEIARTGAVGLHRKETSF